MRRGWRAVGYGLIGFVLLVGVACGSEGPRKASDLTKLKVAATPRLSYGPMYLADYSGYFKDQGIDLEVVELERSSDAIPAVVQGKIDIYGGAPSFALINAIKRTGEIRVVSDKGHYGDSDCPDSAYVSKPSIELTRESLRGKKIVMRTGSIGEYTANLMLEKVGLTINDVQTLDVADNAVPEALSSGGVDVATLNGPAIQRALQDGDKILQANAELAPGLQTGLFAFGSRLLKEDPDLGRRFMVAYMKGVLEWERGKTKENVAVAMRITDLDEDVVRKACWTQFRTDGRINWSAVDKLQKWAFEHDQIDGLLTEDEFWTPEYVEYALKQLD